LVYGFATIKLQLFTYPPPLSTNFCTSTASATYTNLPKTHCQRATPHIRKLTHPRATCNLNPTPIFSTQEEENNKGVGRGAFFLRLAVGQVILQGYLLKVHITNIFEIILREFPSF